MIAAVHTSWIWSECQSVCSSVCKCQGWSVKDSALVSSFLACKVQLGADKRCVLQESAEQMMGGMKAVELKEMNEATSDAKIRDSCFSAYVLKMRVQEETYNDECRVKVSVTR